jgi:hypothetical protein
MISLQFPWKGAPVPNPREPGSEEETAGERSALAGSTVLFLVETPGQAVELLRLTRLLGRSRNVTQIYLIHDCGASANLVVDNVRQAGAKCANQSGSQANALREATRLPLGMGPLVRYFRDLIHLPVFAAQYRRLLRRRRVDLVVVAEDSVSSRSRALLSTAQRLGVSALLLPYTISNPDEIAASLRQQRAYQVRLPHQRAFLAWRPQWGRQEDGRQLLRLPASKAVVLELAGIAPVTPWIDNNGPAIIAAESRAMVRHYKNLGIPDSSLVLTGSLVDSILDEARMERDARLISLRRQLGLSGRPLLLCALPPNQFASGLQLDCEYSGYSCLVAAWASALAVVADRFDVVVRPHPRSTEGELDALKRAGIAVSWDDTASLIPLCDLYVAAISATIRWAIACGRPVLNYDVYRYRYRDYEGLRGIINVESHDQFKVALMELASQPNRLQALSDAQLAIAGEWGCSDGRSEERMLMLYDCLVRGTGTDAGHRRNMAPKRSERGA